MSLSTCPRCGKAFLAKQTTTAAPGYSLYLHYAKVLDDTGRLVIAGCEVDARPVVRCVTLETYARILGAEPRAELAGGGR
jgi:hypothetical protein